MSDVPTQNTERYLTNVEAARLLRLAPPTLTKLRIEGKGPRFYKFGTRVLYSPADLDAWAEQRMFVVTNEPGYPTKPRHRKPKS